MSNAPFLQADGNRRSRPRILAAARLLAADAHPGQLTMEAIAAKAGVTRRTLYNHYANVTDLYKAACGPLFDHCVAALPAEEPDGRPTRVRLHALALDIVGFQRDPLHASLRRMISLHTGTIPVLADHYGNRIVKPLKKIVELRLGALLPRDASSDPASTVLATLDAIQGLDYFLAELTRKRADSIVVDLLLDQLVEQDIEHCQAA